MDEGSRSKSSCFTSYLGALYFFSKTVYAEFLSLQKAGLATKCSLSSKEEKKVYFTSFIQELIG